MVVVAIDGLIVVAVSGIVGIVGWLGVILRG